MHKIKTMAEELRKRVKQTRPFNDPAVEAMLSLMVAASSVRNRLDKICKQHGIFGSQFNILRILAGGPPEGHARCDIIVRMIDRGPDVTRLVDQLEKKGLVTRERSTKDRRMVMHRITDEGRALLNEIDPDLHPVHQGFKDDFTTAELENLSRLCAVIYQRFDETCG